MIRIERVSRTSFFSGWTPGLILGVFSFVAIVGLAWVEGRRTQRNLAPCPLYQLSATPCPLCGGTRSIVHLSSGRPLDAWRANPLISIASPAALCWIVLWIAFGIRITIDWHPLLFAALIAALVGNWLYLKQQSDTDGNPRPFLREVIEQSAERRTALP